MDRIHGTTLVAVRKNGEVVIACDSLMCGGDVVIDAHYDKIFRVEDCLIGVAGSIGDALRFIEQFKVVYEELEKQLDRTLQEFTFQGTLEAEIQTIIVNKDKMYKLWSDDLFLEIKEDIVTAGSGEGYALAAGRVMLEKCSNMSAKEIAEESVKQASRICIFTNSEVLSKKL